MSAQHIILSQRLEEPSQNAQFRDKAKAFIFRHKGIAAVELVVMAALFAVPLFTFSSGVLGLPFVLLMLWLRKANIRDSGLNIPTSWSKAILRGVAALIIILIVQGLIVQPLLRNLFAQPPNFSRFHSMTLSQLLGWIAAGWAMGAFTEEIIRVYLIARLVELFGNSRFALVGAVVVSSLYYVLNHQYQGLAGAIGVVVTCIGLGLLYLFSKRNLWSNVICHGLNDSVVFVAIYFGAFS